MQCIVIVIVCIVVVVVVVVVVVFVVIFVVVLVVLAPANETKRCGFDCECRCRCQSLLSFPLMFFAFAVHPEVIFLSLPILLHVDFGFFSVVPFDVLFVADPLVVSFVVAF